MWRQYVYECVVDLPEVTTVHAGEEKEVEDKTCGKNHEDSTALASASTPSLSADSMLLGPATTNPASTSDFSTTTTTAAAAAAATTTTSAISKRSRTLSPEVCHNCHRDETRIDVPWDAYSQEVCHFLSSFCLEEKSVGSQMEGRTK